MNTVAILVPEQRTIISAALKLIRLRYIGAQEIICKKEKKTFWLKEYYRNFSYPLD